MVRNKKRYSRRPAREDDYTSFDIPILGPEGSYSHQALEKILEELNITEFNPILFDTFEEVHDYADRKTTPFLIPTQNKVTGTIEISRMRGRSAIPFDNYVYWLQLYNNIYISGDDFDTLYIQPAVRKQCSRIIYDLTQLSESGDFSVVEVPSTPEGARLASLNGGITICSDLASSKYDLHLFQEGVSDKEPNQTQFKFYTYHRMRREETNLTMKGLPESHKILIKAITRYRSKT